MKVLKKKMEVLEKGGGATEAHLGRGKNIINILCKLPIINSTFVLTSLLQ